jgi:hypothetical protein
LLVDTPTGATEYFRRPRLRIIVLAPAASKSTIHERTAKAGQTVDNSRGDVQNVVADKWTLLHGRIHGGDL